MIKRPGESVQTACRNLACTLRDNIRLESPDLIVTECWLPPAAQPSADVIITHLHLHGVVEGLAGVFGIRTERPAAATYRTHFCGQASAAPRRQQQRTYRQKIEDREATNVMVVKRAIMLGYLPGSSTDWDKAAAVAIWDYAAATYARTPPRELVLFGERAPA